MTDFPDLKIKVLPAFPSNVIGGVGLEATKVNGHVTLDYAWQEFGAISSIPTSPTSYILTYDTLSNAYVMVPSHLLGGAVAGISDAPNDGVQYGRQSSGWTPVVAGTGTGPAPATVLPLPDATPAVLGASVKYAREDHVHLTDPAIALKAPLASPVFTGDPRSTATLAPGDNDTSLATTAFVQSALSAVSGALPTGGQLGYLLQGPATSPTWSGFVQPGSAFNRTWQNKAAEVVSILDFMNEATWVQGSITTSGIGTDCRSAFVTAWASGAGKRVIIPPGNYRIAGVGLDFTGTVTFDFMPGAVICPDSGIPITFRNPVYAGVRRIFGNNGTVQGIRSVMPEWWGAVADGSTPCSAAINAAIYCGEHAAGSTGHYLLLFQSGQYLINATLSFNMDAADWIVQGAGHSTFLVGAAAATGTCFQVTCTGNHNFKISDFDIFSQTAGSGFSVGFYISANGYHHYSLVSNIFITGFPINWEVANPTRLVKWDRCGGGPDGQSGRTSGSTNVLITCDANTFVGDCDFFSCEWTNCGNVPPQAYEAPSGNNVLLNANASGAHISGIRFIANIFYYSQNSFSISITNGATCDDIWIETCQFEGPETRGPTTMAMNIGVSGSGFIRDLHVNHNYFAGNGYSYHISARCSAGSIPGNWFVTNNFFNAGVTSSVVIDATGSTFTGYVHNGNIHRDCAAGGDINTFINMNYITCTGNTCSGNTTGNRFFATGAGGDWHVLTGNNSAGQRSTPYSIGVAHPLFSGLNL